MKYTNIFFYGSINLLTRGMIGSRKLAMHPLDFSRSLYQYLSVNQLTSFYLSFYTAGGVNFNKNKENRQGFIKNLLNTLNVSSNNYGFIQNEETKLEIEKFIMDSIRGYNLANFNKSNIINDINQNYLGVVVYSFVDEREEMINKYISNLSNIKAEHVLWI